jgi:hypothetical protein
MDTDIIYGSLGCFVVSRKLDALCTGSRWILYRNRHGGRERAYLYTVRYEVTERASCRRDLEL